MFRSGWGALRRQAASLLARTHLQGRGTIGCSNDAATESGPEVAEGYRYSCEQGANVVWGKYKAGSHDWPSGDRGADVRAACGNCSRTIRDRDS